MKPFAVVFTYSFDCDCAVYPVDTQDEAIKFMTESYEEELRIDKEENKWDTEGYIAEDKMYAKIVNHFADGDDVTEFHVANVYDQY